MKPPPVPGCLPPMSWQALQLLSVAVPMTRYHWVLTRAAYLRHIKEVGGPLAAETGWHTHEAIRAALPFPVPPTGVLARKVTAGGYGGGPGGTSLPPTYGEPETDCAVSQGLAAGLQFTAQSDWLNPGNWRSAAPGEYVLGEWPTSYADPAYLPPDPHAWWADTEWGREVIEFRPPLVQGAFHTWNPAVEYTVDDTDLVAIPWPHPYYPEGVIPESWYRWHPVVLTISYDGDNYYQQGFRLLSGGRRVLFNHPAHRHGLVRLPHPVQPPTGPPILFVSGNYIHHLSGNWLRTQDAQWVAVGVLTITGLVVLAAFGGIGGAGIVTSGAVGVSGSTLAFAGAALAVTGGLAAGEVATGVDLGGLDTYRELAKFTVYLDAAGLGSIWVEAFRQAAIVAQGDRADRLRLSLARLSAGINQAGGLTLAITRTVVGLVTAYLQGSYVEGLALDAGQEAALALVDAAIGQAHSQLIALNARELEPVIDAHVRQYELTRLDELNALITERIAAASVPPPPALPPPTPEVPASNRTRPNLFVRALYEILTLGTEG